MEDSCDRSGMDIAKRAIPEGGWCRFRLAEEIEKVSPDTGIYKFEIPPDSTLRLNPGDHVIAYFDVAGRERFRYYSPISRIDARGYFTLAIKTYPKGIVSREFSKLRVGDEVKFSGPVGRFLYKRNMADHMYMVAGGTGITPIYSVIQQALSDNEDHSTIELLFGNKTVKDILIQKEISRLQEKHKDRFKVTYIVDGLDTNETSYEEWKERVTVGLVNDNILKKFIPSPPDRNKKTLVLTCGPSILAKIVRDYSVKNGYTEYNEKEKEENTENAIVFSFNLLRKCHEL